MSSLSTKIVESLFIRTKDENRKLWFHRFLVLILTFFVYVIYHMTRKPMSVVKSKLFNGNVSDNENWAPFDGHTANELLSLVDGAYWGTYALAIFFTGYIAERSNLRYYLTISMLLCGMMCIIFGMSYYLHIHSLIFFMVVAILSGMIEATGWPAVIAIIGGWFGSKKKGFIFGVWSLHTSIGNMLGTTIAGAFVDHCWGLSFIVPGVICMVFAIIVFLLLIPKPSDVDLNVDMALPEKDSALQFTEMDLGNSSTTTVTNVDLIESAKENVKPNDNKAINFWSAFAIPGVLEFSVCFFFTKSVSYIFLNWLPKFISHKHNISSSRSAYISIMFDIGGCVGSIMAGLLADLTGTSGIICMLFLMMTIPSLICIIYFSQISVTINLLLQFFGGFFINGPYSLILTTVAANLACKVPTKMATATISAIIDGTGSIGAAVGPTITGPIMNRFNWESVFYLCMIGNFIAALCLVHIACTELKRKWNRFFPSRISLFCCSSNDQ